MQQFDASLTDVFQVQADIASKVANALGVVLGDSARRELIAKPTENLAAYDEFLKGEAAAQGMKADQARLRRAIAFYERAVALDSTFVQAWSQLSRRQDLSLLQRRPCRNSATRRGSQRRCSGLKQFQRELTDGEPVRGFFVSTEKDAILAAAFIDANGSTLVHLPPETDPEP